MFRVVELGLYYQIALMTHLFPEFITWLGEAYIEHKYIFLFTEGTKILDITPQLIRKSLCYPPT